jgi:hypothetical protein
MSTSAGVDIRAALYWRGSTSCNSRSRSAMSFLVSRSRSASSRIGGEIKDADAHVSPENAAPRAALPHQAATQDAVTKSARNNSGRPGCGLGRAPFKRHTIEAKANGAVLSDEAVNSSGSWYTSTAIFCTSGSKPPLTAFPWTGSCEP